MSGRHFFDYAAGAVQLLLCNARKRSYCLETISSDFCYCVVRVDGAERFLFYVPLLPCYGTGLYLWLFFGINSAHVFSRKLPFCNCFVFLIIF